VATTRVRGTSDMDESSEDLGIVDALVQVSFLVQRVLARAAEHHDVSIVMGRLVGILRDRTPTMGELALLLGLDKSSLSGLVDRAQARGLVRRHAAADDGRSVRVSLTPAGHRLVLVGGAEIADELAAIAACLAPSRQAALSKLASELVHHDALGQGIDLTAGRYVPAPTRRRRHVPASTTRSTT
jgi:DNA-binding MarR family transcriptional regulator